jgi:DNA-binding SARP family transcriptional activator
MNDLDFRILGPVEVFRDGHSLPLGRGKLTDLFATLAVSPNQVVSIGALTETVWHIQAPERPRAALHSAVARLRQIIGHGFIETHSSGYRFSVQSSSFDLFKFSQITAAARQEQRAQDALDLLTEAIGLWRGTPLENVTSPVLLNSAVPRLAETFLSTCEQWASLCLQTGRHEAAVAKLNPLIDEHPFRERMAGQLMLGLYRCGRQADAIAAYESLRHRLGEEMGIDPAQELQELHLKILRADPSLRGAPGQTNLITPVLETLPAATEPGLVKLPGLSASSNGSTSVAPRRLPSDTRAFTGRKAELARLLELADSDARSLGAVPVLAIDGMAGIGKTALAVHAAHLLAERFGDGQLFIDLHGYTEGYPPRSPDEALETFLRALGLPASAIPEDTEERAALYRDRLAGTRTLVVLDNAADETQVRPLIPGDGGCLVLVTSRRQLKGLQDAHAVALDVLAEPEAIALLREVAGPGRIAADDPAAAEIAGLCGRLPIAVRIAAALIRSRTGWSPRDLAGRLRAAQAGLDAFSVGDQDLAAMFGLSSQTLHHEQRRLYACLGLIPGPEIDALAAAALLGADPVTAERLLQELVDQSLLLEPAAGRYRMHDLIRAHARGLTLADACEAEGDRAIARLLNYYQHTAGRADARISWNARPSPYGLPPAHAPALSDAAAARALLRAERANLIACLQYAIDGGRDELTVALSAGLASLLRIDGPWSQGMLLHTAAAAAAGRLGDRSGQADALTRLAILRRLACDFPGAGDSLREALELHSEAGDKAGQAHALLELGSLGRLSGDSPGADRSLRAALRLYRETDDKAGQAYALTDLGIVRRVSGEYPDALRSLHAALRLYPQAGEKAGQARALAELAETEVQRQAGDYQDAARNAAAALGIFQELGDRLGQAHVLTALGKVRSLDGDYQGAAADLTAALKVYEDLDDRFGRAKAQALLAQVWGLSGDYQSAARELEQAIDTYQELGSPGNQAWALNHYGALMTAADEPGRAIPLYRDALRLARQVCQPDDEAAALHGLGQSYLRTGKPTEGADCLRQAQGIYQRLGMPAAEQITLCLAEIEGDAEVARVSRSSSPAP